MTIDPVQAAQFEHVAQDFVMPLSNSVNCGQIISMTPHLTKTSSNSEQNLFQLLLFIHIHESWPKLKANKKIPPKLKSLDLYAYTYIMKKETNPSSEIGKRTKNEY